MGKSPGHKIARGLLWTAASLVALVVFLPVALYIPAVQDFVKDIAVREASKATGMTIAVERLRLRWPLRLSVEGVSILQTPADTMLTARRLDVGVRLFPLFQGDVDVCYARLDSAFYQMGNADSLMWLRARIDRAEISPSHLKMNMEAIDLGRVALDGADVSLAMRPDTAAAPVDTSAANPMVIRAADITLSRIAYRMTMLPTIDSLGCEIESARLTDGLVDLTRRRIRAGALSVDSVTATYLTPSAAWLKANPKTAFSEVADTVTPALSDLWTITADSLRLTARKATYAQRGVRPLPGLDMSCLQVTDAVIAVDSFYNRGTEITVPLRRLELTERCGLHITAKGTFAMDSAMMRAEHFDIATHNSSLMLDAAMGIGDLMADPLLPLRLAAEGRIGLADAVLAMPSLKATVAKFPAPRQLVVAADVAGTPSRLDVRRLAVDYPGMLRLRANGSVASPFNPDRISGDIAVDGRLTSTRALRRTITEARLMPGLSLPGSMTVKGRVAYRPMQVNGDLTVTADGTGRVALRGRWNGRAESYDARLTASDFPVEAFLPDLGVAGLSATVTARGRGYNPLSASTEMHLSADVTRVSYNHQPFADVMLRADIAGGHADGTISSGNPSADLDLDFDADLATDSGIGWDIDGEVRHLDLMALGFMADTCAGTLALKSHGIYNPRTGYLDGRLTVDDVDWQTGATRIIADRTDIDALLSDTLVRADVANGDLTAAFTSPCRLDTLLARINALTRVAGRQVASRNINVDSLQRAMPPFAMMLEMGRSNVAAHYLSASGIGIGHAAMTASNDSLLRLTAGVTDFSSGSIRLDTINLTARQHGQYLVYSAMVNNRPGTMDDFAHVTLNGFLGHDRLTALLRQRNIKGDTGFRIGFAVAAADSTVTLRLVPYSPVIAYRQWRVNTDNYLSYNLYNHHIGADITLGDSISSLRLYSDSTHVHTADTHVEDLVLQLRDIRLQDWLSLSPWAPPMKGSVSADMRVHLSRENITGNGTVNLADFFYNNERVGTFDVDVDVETDPSSGLLRADMALMVDSVRTVTVSGTLNDSTSHSPFLLDFNMIRFPLRVANPFLPAGMAKLSGMLNGRMDISGDMARPVFNGWLNFDSTAVRVTMLGTDFRFPETKIPVDSGVVTFDGFGITACNDNPLVINGTANLRDLADIGLDLSLKARDMMIVNSTRARGGADVYGKAGIDLSADVRGSLGTYLRVSADASLLSGTNVTYVIPTATSTLASASTDVDKMVHFVSFNDSAQVARADSVARSLALILDAGLTIEEGTTVTVDLSPDASSKVQVQGQGELSFSMSPVNTGRLTGQIGRAHV